MAKTGSDQKYNLSEFAETIGDDVRRQNRLARRLTEEACEPTTNPDRLPDIIGYRVTYEYRGKSMTKTLDHPPGKRLPVNVNVRAVR
jgi:uncharacterized protein YcfJ